MPENLEQSSNVTEITSEKVKCFYTNADQLRNKIDKLKLQIVLESPEFIFVTEVLPKVDNDVNCSSVLYQIDGYNTFPSSDGNRGVIIYARSDLNVSPHVYLNDIYGDASWCDWIVDSKKVLLGAIYRSPSSTDSCVTINRLLNEATSLSQTLLITGDFNMKDINWENYTTIHNETHYEYDFIECIKDNFLFQHISDFTRIRENQTPHILDLVLTKDENDIENITILPSLGVSDHVLIQFDFLCSFSEHCTGKPKIKYSNCDFAAFTVDWENEKWEERLEGLNIDNMWECFSQKYHESVEKYVPKYIKKKKDVNLNPNG